MVKIEKFNNELLLVEIQSNEITMRILKKLNTLIQRHLDSVSEEQIVLSFASIKNPTMTSIDVLKLRGIMWYDYVGYFQHTHFRAILYPSSHLAKFVSELVNKFLPSSRTLYPFTSFAELTSILETKFNIQFDKNELRSRLPSYIKDE